MYLLCGLEVRSLTNAWALGLHTLHDGSRLRAFVALVSSPFCPPPLTWRLHWGSWYCYDLVPRCSPKVPLLNTLFPASAVEKRNERQGLRESKWDCWGQGPWKKHLYLAIVLKAMELVTVGWKLQNHEHNQFLSSYKSPWVLSRGHRELANITWLARGECVSTQKIQCSCSCLFSRSMQKAGPGMCPKCYNLPIFCLLCSPALCDALSPFDSVLGLSVLSPHHSSSSKRTNLIWGTDSLSLWLAYLRRTSSASLFHSWVLWEYLSLSLPERSASSCSQSPEDLRSLGGCWLKSA